MAVGMLIAVVDMGRLRQINVATFLPICANPKDDNCASTVIIHSAHIISIRHHWHSLAWNPRQITTPFAVVCTYEFPADIAASTVSARAHSHL